jgi:hypothetical protein
VRPVSPKQRKLYDEHMPARRAFLNEFAYRCAICGACGDPEGISSHAVHVHEIVNGPNRMRAFGRREAWLPACNLCNGGVLTDKSIWPYAAQLMVKLELDPEWFSLKVINELFAPKDHPNPPQRITADDVLACIVKRNQLQRGYGG